MPPLKFWWYDGDPNDPSVKPLRPHEDIAREIVALRGSLPASGCLLIGDKGKIFTPDDYGWQFYFMLAGDSGFTPSKTKVDDQEVEHEAIRHVPQTIPRLPSSNNDQMQKKEWLDAVRGGPPAYSNFDIAAYLTEIILLGCVAMRVGVGRRLEWDGPKMRAKDAPEAAQYVHREYRKGWEL